MRTRQERHKPIPAAIRPRVKARPSREAALAARIAELENELRARDDFLAIAAHELRNPMTPIVAGLELLLAKTRQMSEPLPRDLLQSIERLERLVHAYVRRAAVLLEVSRINSGIMHLAMAEMDLSELMRRVTANMLPLAEQASCQLRLSVQEGVTGVCDKMAMEQILENLLSNAIRYGPGEPVEIEFNSDSRMARLSVRDQGIGISQRDQAKIFDRLHNLCRSSPNGGLGIGLWITRQLVRAMGGEITVSSKPGSGSIFSVVWPIAPRTERHAG